MDTLSDSEISQTLALEKFYTQSWRRPPFECLHRFFQAYQNSNYQLTIKPYFSELRIIHHILYCRQTELLQQLWTMTPLDQLANALSDALDPHLRPKHYQNLANLFSNQLSLSQIDKAVQLVHQFNSNQQAELAQAFINNYFEGNCIPAKFTPWLIHTLLQNKQLNDRQQTWLMTQYLALPDDQANLTRLKQRIIQNLSSIRSPSQATLSGQHITLANGQQYDIDKIPNDCRLNLASWEDYRNLRTRYPSHFIAQVCQQHGFFSKRARLYTPTLQDLETTPQERQVVNMIQKGQALAKIVSAQNPENWTNLLKQLQNPSTYRPKCRNSHYGPYKWVARTNEIVKTRPEKRSKGTHHATKKTPVTWLASHCQTPVFGYHDYQRPLVGLIFDSQALDDAHFKHLSLYDFGSVDKG